MKYSLLSLTARTCSAGLVFALSHLATADSVFDGVFELSSLDGSNGFQINGIDSGDRSGYSVSNAGDVNGDGIDDVIIGAIFADQFRFQANPGIGKTETELPINK